MTNPRITLRVVVALATTLSSMPAQEPIAAGQGATETAPEAASWPREFSRADGARLIVYQPQIDEWDSYLKLAMRAAIRVVPADPQIKPAVGALLVTADTKADMVRQTAYLNNLAIQSIHFPGGEGAEQERLAGIVRELLPQRPLTISMERLVAMVERSQDTTQGVAVSLEPPPIFFSNEPALLVIIDGDPVGIDIEATGLQYVVNTNWDLFIDSSDSAYYLLDEDQWLTAASLDGTWSPTAALPAGFAKLPAEENWAEVRKALPAQAQKERAPKVIVSLQPSELILSEGAPQLAPVPDTDLMWLVNSDSDVFYHPEQRKFYYLTSGRWFRAESLAGPWESATTELPDDFARIPESHPSGDVLSTVPGTEQADEAVLLASIPQTATLKRDAAKAEAQYFGEEPDFQPIPETSLEYAANSPQDIIVADNRYYMCEQGVWFVASDPKGPWGMADKIPEEIYSIPPESPKHNVTYVTVVESDDDSVSYAQTAGYIGLTIAFGVAMWGTGYYYPPYWGYGYHPYPIYWRPPYYSYGVGAWYNPRTGAYGRGVRAYGPWGGYGRSAAYNPRTGSYARGGSAWGPYGSAWGMQGYNARTGTSVRAGGFNDYGDAYGAGYRARNGYDRWGAAVIGEGDDAIAARYKGDERGTAYRLAGDEGGQAIGYNRRGGGSGMIGYDDDENLYVGKDGNVYKRDDDGNWYGRDGDDWDKVDDDRVNQARQELEQPGQERGGASERGERAGGSLSPEQREAAQQRAGQSGELQTRAAEARSGGGEPAARAQQARSERPTNRDLGINPSVRELPPSSAVVGGLERDARARSRGSQRTQQRQSWERSNRNRSYSSRSYPSRGGASRSRGSFGRGRRR